MPSLSDTSHRPYPLPSGPWVMGQRWHDLLFAHWRVEPDAVRALIPDQLEVDMFDGSAWVAVVPFRMTGVRFRGMPGIRGISAFLELNVRTYVRARNMEGVYFFSLDAASSLAVAVARRWFHLPYFNARMALDRSGATIHYRSHRIHRDAPGATLDVSYRPTGDVQLAAPGTIEHWLTERYRLLTVDPNGRILTGEIHHGPWQLAPAEAEFRNNTMTEWAGLDMLRPPDHLCYAAFQDVSVWRPRALAP